MGAAGKTMPGDRNYRQRWFKNPSQQFVDRRVERAMNGVLATLPDAPCGYCGVRDGCRHREAAYA